MWKSHNQMPFFIFQNLNEFTPLLVLNPCISRSKFGTFYPKAHLLAYVPVAQKLSNYF